MNVVIGGDKSLIFASGANDIVAFRPAFWPTDVPGLSSWFSADYGVYTNTTTLAQDGNTVNIWNSRVNGITLSQSTLLKQPKFENGGIKFDGAIGFNNSDINSDLLSGTNSAALISPLNYYVVASGISGATTNAPAPIIKQSNNTISNSPYVFAINNISVLGAANTQNISTSLNAGNTKSVTACIFTDNNNATIRNGSSTQSIIALGNASNSDTTFYVGGFSQTSQTSSNALMGTIYEILIYSGVEHTTEQQNLVLQYLSQKWGVA